MSAAEDGHRSRKRPFVTVGLNNNKDDDNDLEKDGDTEESPAKQVKRNEQPSEEQLIKDNLTEFFHWLKSKYRYPSFVTYALRTLGYVEKDSGAQEVKLSPESENPHSKLKHCSHSASGQGNKVTVVKDNSLKLLDKYYIIKDRSNVTPSGKESTDGFSVIKEVPPSDALLSRTEVVLKNNGTSVHHESVNHHSHSVTSTGETSKCTTNAEAASEVTVQECSDDNKPVSESRTEINSEIQEKPFSATDVNNAEDSKIAISVEESKENSGNNTQACMDSHVTIEVQKWSKVEVNSKDRNVSMEKDKEIINSENKVSRTEFQKTHHEGDKNSVQTTSTSVGEFLEMSDTNFQATDETDKQKDKRVSAASDDGYNLIAKVPEACGAEAKEKHVKWNREQDKGILNACSKSGSGEETFEALAKTSHFYPRTAAEI